MCAQLGIEWGRPDFVDYVRNWWGPLVPEAVIQAFDRHGKQFIPPSYASSEFQANAVSEWGVA